MSEFFNVFRFYEILWHGHLLEWQKIVRSDVQYIVRGESGESDIIIFGLENLMEFFNTAYSVANRLTTVIHSFTVINLEQFYHVEYVIFQQDGGELVEHHHNVNMFFDQNGMISKIIVKDI